MSATTAAASLDGISLPVERGRRSSPFARLTRLYSPLAILALWQIGSATGLIPVRILASPATILATFTSLLVSGQLIVHLGVSLARVAVGTTIGVALGTGFAIVCGLWRPLEEALDPPLQMLRTIPFLGLTPLLILWFGIGEPPKLIMIVLASMFPIYVTLFAGIRAVDPKLIEAGKVFGLDRWGLIRNIILPGALPSALVGLRYSLGISWLTLVVGKQINADKGIGYLIMDARDFLRTDVIVVGLLVYAGLGLATDAIVRLVEQRWLRWRPTMLKSVQ